MTEAREVEGLKNVLAAAERGSIDPLVNFLWTTLPAEKVVELQRAVTYRPLPIPKFTSSRAEDTPQDALTDTTIASENHLSEIEALRHALKEEEARVKLEAAASEKEARVRQLEARVAELASESSANESAYTNQCNKTAAFASEAADLRKQLETARHTLVGISDATLEDWQEMLERAETAEARVTHLEERIALAEGDSELLLCDVYDKAVADAVGEVPEDMLHDWAALNVGKSGRLMVIARAELARKEARRGREEAQRVPRLGDLVYYMLESRVHSAPITSILVVENAHDDWAHTDEQKKTWQPFGPSATKYGTTHGILDATKCFPTKEALLASL